MTPIEGLSAAWKGGDMVDTTRQTCCSSPAAMCYWFAVSLVAWGVLSAVGIYWHPLHASSAATILIAASIGCFANWRRNRTFHCGITGPIFLIGGLAFLLANAGLLRLSTSWVWPFVLVGTGVAFLLEWRHAGTLKA
jgi:hypothetical protein